MVAGPLCYLLGVVSAIAFLILEKRDHEVRFHAYQSLATFGGLFVLSAAAAVVPLIGALVVTLLTPRKIRLGTFRRHYKNTAHQSTATGLEAQQSSQAVVIFNEPLLLFEQIPAWRHCYATNDYPRRVSLGV